MTSFWLNSQSERLVAAHLADACPAWVWAADGERLVWRNRAALAYEQTRRREPTDTLVPVPRQIPRAIRLGAMLRPSRARLQFSLGRKPISETCTCTPLFLAGNAGALLVAMAEPVAAEALAAIAQSTDSVLPFIGNTSHYVLTGRDGSVLMSGGAGSERLAAGQTPLSEMTAGADASRLILYPEAETSFAPNAATEKVGEVVNAEELAETAPSIGEPSGDAEAMAVVVVAADESTPGPADITPPEEHQADSLLRLLDRLDGRQVLYQPLGDEDDESFDPPPVPALAEAQTTAPDLDTSANAPETVADHAAMTPDAPSAEFTDAPGTETKAAPDEAVTPEFAPPALNAPLPPDKDVSEPANAEESDKAVRESAPVRLWRVIGHSFLGHPDRASDADGPQDSSATPENLEPQAAAFDTVAQSAETTVVTEDADLLDTSGCNDSETESSDAERLVAALSAEKTQKPDPEHIERTSRYNFDELSRILIDRVSGDGDATRLPFEPATPFQGSLVNLGDETLILNRLPLGLLVFRDQQILFSNRALADLLGYADGSSLRQAGLAGVFPDDSEQVAAGPVTKLMGADGRTLTVLARLQTVSWQGKPALLLSASRRKEPLNAEDLARSFAATLADALEYGYFETSRAGILTSVSGRAASLMNRAPDSLIGRPIAGMLTLSEGAHLRSFLEQPARFAGVDRPMKRFEGSEAHTEIILFAEGMAGIVTGYFGLLRPKGGSIEKMASRSIDPDFLVRLSHFIRQPVNAIVGFADMIRTQAFGPIGNDRYADYARFIRSAGRDIAGIVDELEDYSKLCDGDFPLRTGRISLIDLLEHCMSRVRPYANTARVLVRSAISTGLPEISADEETLKQAVLNVLASAVAHSPSGGQVVLSAQKRPDGAIEVHVRDSNPGAGDDLDSSFVVFRDGSSADGEALSPLRSAIGLALTRSLLAVNACALQSDPGPGNGTLFCLVIPAALVEISGSVQR